MTGDTQKDEKGRQLADARGVSEELKLTTARKPGNSIIH
jgi:hypothetical protein